MANLEALPSNSLYTIKILVKQQTNVLIFFALNIKNTNSILCYNFFLNIHYEIPEKDTWRHLLTFCTEHKINRSAYGTYIVHVIHLKFIFTCGWMRMTVKNLSPPLLCLHPALDRGYLLQGTTR